MKHVRRLTLPAPRRESYSEDGRTFATRAWTLKGVQECKAGGGWFAKSRHTFDSKETARAAGVVYEVV